MCWQDFTESYNTCVYVLFVIISDDKKRMKTCMDCVVDGGKRLSLDIVMWKVLVRKDLKLKEDRLYDL